jgi:hypothetical protein
MQEFLKAASTIGSDVYPRLKLLEDVKKFDLRVSLLLYGFDEKGVAHIIEIKNPGEAIPRDSLQFWAIGSGAPIAMGALMRHTHAPNGEISCIYRTAEAKFAAQIAPGVGNSTIISLLYADGRSVLIPPNKAAQIRDLWELD